MTTKLGTATYLKRSGISAPIMRGLEAAGVISPTRSDTNGWRQFSESDVAATLRWKAQRKVGGARR